MLTHLICVNVSTQKDMIAVHQCGEIDTCSKKYDNWNKYCKPIKFSVKKCEFASEIFWCQFNLVHCSPKVFNYGMVLSSGIIDHIRLKTTIITYALTIWC